MKSIKNRRTIVVYLTIVSLLVCSFASTSAFAADGVSNEQQMIISFFEKEYTIWDNDGQDITASFYSTMSPYYEVGDYEAIGDYLLEHVSRAISSPTTTVVGSRSTLRIISQQRSFYERVTDEIHDWGEWNAFFTETAIY